MKFSENLRFNPYLLRIVTVVAIAFSLTSCSSKSADCTKLIGMISEGQTLVVNLSPKLDATATKQLSQELNMISQEIETLTIKDKPLQTFQKNSIQQFRDLSNTLKPISEALTTAEKVSVSPEGKQQLLQAQKTIEEAGGKAKQIASKNEALFKELVNYCPQKTP
ncbi:conserved exported hypothetical protein [Planktothrix serta PCC 8927]|uniref:Lipoprotein n=1 Tax=Planktothrix serta PCC 8927 TaxID=671068 RepID=A0A7Z9E0M9_9CYAN|nr:hypothetical protein [Planktothrix serta]VXD16849.1 conserved exported hypothetical protein [Planktothrix serta PCC 8927]